jgi:hypothetical protein
MLPLKQQQVNKSIRDSHSSISFQINKMMEIDIKTIATISDPKI